MEISLRFLRFRLLAEQPRSNRSIRALIAIALLLPFVAALSSGQAPTTVTISGAVYDPRGASGLPLPNVLVYASTTPVTPPPSGVQCLTYANQTPSGANVVSYTYTAADGTFTLQNIPEGATYTIVIQAGKWQRQFPNVAIGTGAPASLVLSMPANHTQGNLPMIAIPTGSVDGAECVLRDMGISDSEFTDDNGSVNPGGFIHLYKGSSAAGAQINASTPTETALMNGTSATPLNSYDMVMFPCQGGASGQATTTGATNLLNFAEAGGRIFATHYSYAWLDPATPFDAQFGDVANWTTNTEQSLVSGVGTVLTNFSDGAILAQWLENAGSTVPGTSNQIDISTLRTDVGSVVAPTQSWVTLNNGSYGGQTGNPVMQMTFNVPVASPASSQCGRVMYNDYHVINAATGGKTYPTECPSYNNASYKMSAQEEMLEYALFDLSAFVQPVVVPTLNVTFNPSPLVVKSGDTADQLTVNVTNTSATTETDSSAVLTFALPPQLTITAMSDPTGGWICTVATASCSRNSDLPASTTDSVMLTLSVASYTTLSSYTGTITATVSSVTFSTNPSFTDNVIFQQPPSITWATPAPIIYGTALSATQLDASASVGGSFSYNPPTGTVLSVGQHTLAAAFTPTDTTDYTTANATVTLTVLPANPVVNLTASANPIFLMAGVTFTASIPSIANTPSGTVTFLDGTSAMGTGTLTSGVATFTTSSLAVGPHSITAAYSGDTSYGPGTSRALTETIQDFTLAPSNGGGSASVPAGGLAVYALVVSPVDGSTLPATVNLSFAGLPLEAAGVLTPVAVNVNSPATGVTLQVKLPGQLAANVSPRVPFHSGRLPVVLGLILLPFARKLRKARFIWCRLAVLVLVGAALATSLSGCGGSLTPQSFSFTVSGASGSLTHTITVTLTVQ